MILREHLLIENGGRRFCRQIAGLAGHAPGCALRVRTYNGMCGMRFPFAFRVSGSAFRALPSSLRSIFLLLLLLLVLVLVLELLSRPSRTIKATK
jgi:hypothetical protein